MTIVETRTESQYNAKDISVTLRTYYNPLHGWNMAEEFTLDKSCSRRPDAVCVETTKMEPKIIGLEYKVSLQDFKKELKNNCEKSKMIRKMVNEFYIVIPQEIESVIKDIMPDDWGLITVNCFQHTKRTVKKAKYFGNKNMTLYAWSKFVRATSKQTMIAMLNWEFRFSNKGALK